MGRIRSTAGDAMPADTVHVIDREVDAVLANWGAWAGARIGVSRQAQAMFRMASGGARATAASASAGDVEQAWRVEKVVCNPAFSPRFRAVLMAHYVLHRSKSTTCRDLGLHWAAYDHEVWRAAVYFWDRYVKQLAAEC